MLSLYPGPKQGEGSGARAASFTPEGGQNRRKEKKWIDGKEKWKKEGKKGNKLAA